MQVCSSLQTDNHASTPPLSFLQAGCPFCRPTNSVKALKANIIAGYFKINHKVALKEGNSSCVFTLYHPIETPQIRPSMLIIWAQSHNKHKYWIKHTAIQWSTVALVQLVSWSLGWVHRSFQKLFLNCGVGFLYVGCPTWHQLHTTELCSNNVTWARHLARFHRTSRIHQGWQWRDVLHREKMLHQRLAAVNKTNTTLLILNTKHYYYTQITTPAPYNSVFLQARCPSCHPTNSVKALKA